MIGYDGYLVSEVNARRLPAGQTVLEVGKRLDQILGM